jgi:hypothetical protein
MKIKNLLLVVYGLKVRYFKKIKYLYNNIICIGFYIKFIYTINNNKYKKYKIHYKKINII